MPSAGKLLLAKSKTYFTASLVLLTGNVGSPEVWEVFAFKAFLAFHNIIYVANGYLFNVVNLPPKAVEDFLFHARVHCFLAAPLYENEKMNSCLKSCYILHSYNEISVTIHLHFGE